MFDRNVWCIKFIKLKQYPISSDRTFNLQGCSIKHRYFNRYSLHSISHTITRFHQFHRNITCQESSYSIPKLKHHSNFCVIPFNKIILKEKGKACIKRTLYAKPQVYHFMDFNNDTIIFQSEKQNSRIFWKLSVF